jgi:hypothetical protein
MEYKKKYLKYKAKYLNIKKKIKGGKEWPITESQQSAQKRVGKPGDPVGDRELEYINDDPELTKFMKRINKLNKLETTGNTDEGVNKLDIINRRLKECYNKIALIYDRKYNARDKAYDASEVNDKNKWEEKYNDYYALARKYRGNESSSSWRIPIEKIYKSEKRDTGWGIVDTLAVFGECNKGSVSSQCAPFPPVQKDTVGYADYYLNKMGGDQEPDWSYPYRNWKDENQLCPAIPYSVEMQDGVKKFNVNGEEKN